jgi:DICT domain-containing protein
MEDDLNFFLNGRRPQFFFKWKTTSILLKMEDNLNFFLMEEDLNIFVISRQPQYLQTEDDLINIVDGSQPLKIT